MIEKEKLYVVGGYGLTDLYFRSESNAKKNFTTRCIKYAQADGCTPEDFDCESWREYAEECWNLGGCKYVIDWWTIELED